MWVKVGILKSFDLHHRVGDALVYHKVIVGAGMASRQLGGMHCSINNIETHGPRSELRHTAAASRMAMFVLLSLSASFRYMLSVYRPPLRTAPVHERCNLCLIATGMRSSGARATPVPARTTTAQPPEPWCSAVLCAWEMVGFQPAVLACLSAQNTAASEKTWSLAETRHRL